jgi:hypothetical protein
MKSRTQETFAKKWVGGVDVMTGDNVAKLTSIDINKDGKVKLFPDGSESIKVKIADLPKAAQRVIKPGMKVAKKFRVRLDTDGTDVEAVTPYSGVFRARAVGLGPKTQDGEYRLIKKTYNEGKENENSHLEFLAIYEIVDGVFRGVELPGFYLHYKFEEIPEGEEDEGFTRFNTVDTPQASQLHKLQAWSEVHGNILDEPIKWTDDGIILETLEDRVVENDREVNLVFEKGYIKTVQPVEDYEEDEDPDEVVKEDLPDFLQDTVEVTPKTVKGKSKSPAKKVSKSSDDDDDL